MNKEQAMKVSARNRLEGTISTVNPGAVNTEVVLDLGGNDKLVAVVTSESAKRMGLTAGKRAIGLVKAPSVTIVTDAANYRFSARNQYAGEVTRVEKGAVNSEVAIKLPGGTVISAVVTNDAVSELQLAAGKPATALIKASQVIIGVSA
jgi:molybdate transport system regulatory protein